MAEQKEPTFVQCLMMCIGEPEFVKEFNRLTGCNLGNDSRSALDKMIDKATGYQEILDKELEADFQEFINFVYNFVWLTYLRVRESEKEKPGKQ